ncbi:unnamed protein product [Oppiella nova]|uniref:Uncharacterized protein n=1 Tax=Oppiella nova TaxID=334625 RepID=A0A7R9MI50_9ACAR|nr:unnamed protein product [Oppiella nova]CAG2177387.1 unnamed protein product [Oppiella nova]
MTCWKPPSNIKLDPVTNDGSSDVRYNTAFDTSMGLPTRPKRHFLALSSKICADFALFTSTLSVQ